MIGSSAIAAEWSANGPPGTAAFGQLVTDPALAGTIYTNGEDGLFQSTDGGRTWASLRVIGDPASPVAAGPEGTIYAQSSVGDPSEIPPMWVMTVYKSTDGGGSWGPLFQGTNVWYTIYPVTYTPTTLYRVSAFAPADLHFPVYTGAFHRSLDGGLTWIAADEGLGLSLSGVSAVALDPSASGTLYLATSPGGTPLGGAPASPAMFKSTDAGETWTLLANAPAVSVTAIVVEPDGTVLVSGFGSLFRSTDGGSSFSLIGSPFVANGNLTALVADPRDPNRLYASTLGGAGVLESVDGGVTWTPISAGLSGSSLYVTALVIDPSGSSLYATTEEPGVFVYPLRYPRSGVGPPTMQSPRPRVAPERPSALHGLR